MPPSPRQFSRGNNSFWRSGWMFAFLGLLATASYLAMPSMLLGDAFEPKIQGRGDRSLNGESIEGEIAVQENGDKLMHASFSRKDLSYPLVKTKSNENKNLNTQVAAQAGGANGDRRTKIPVSMLAILSRYNDDLEWLIDPNTGLMNNSTGTPQFILPIEIYQASDIDAEGFPTFPGLLPPAPKNITDAANLTSAELLSMNYSAYGPLEMLPTWPEWAWKFVIEKNATKDKNRPGSQEEAEYLARKRLGLPLDGNGPSDYQEWRDYEHLFDEEYRRNRKRNQLGESNEEKSFFSAENEDSILEDLPIDATTIANNKKPEERKQKIEKFRQAFSKFTAENRSEIVTIPDISPVLPLKIMPNRGSEALAYLSAVIDHYDNLPDLMIFMHGHRLAWHTPLLGQDWMLRRLVTHPPTDLKLSSTNGYHSLACLERWGNDISQLFPTSIDANWRSNNGPRWHEALSARFAQAWREHLGEAYNMPLPDYVRVPAAATFIATRDAIKRRPREFYVGVRDWLLKTHIESKWLGIVMEFQMAIMFANKTHFSVSQEFCLCDLYNICTLPAEL